MCVAGLALRRRPRFEHYPIVYILIFESISPCPSVPPPSHFRNFLRSLPRRVSRGPSGPPARPPFSLPYRSARSPNFVREAVRNAALAVRAVPKYRIDLRSPGQMAIGYLREKGGTSFRVDRSKVDTGTTEWGKVSTVQPGELPSALTAWSELIVITVPVDAG
jgi:hypothetical protein